MMWTILITGSQDHPIPRRGNLSVAHGILPRAVPCILERLCFVCLPQLCNVVCQRIVGVGCRKKSLDGEKDGSNLKSRTPLLLQDVQADSPKLVYVWVVDPRDEPDFWSSHRVIFWQKQLQFEHTSLK